MFATASILGRLTADPIQKDVVRDGKEAKVVEFSLACNDPKGKPHFFDIAVWDGLGDGVFKSRKKGDQVAVQGDMRWSEWEKDGVKNRRLRIVARNVEFGAKSAANESA